MLKALSISFLLSVLATTNAQKDYSCVTATNTKGYCRTVKDCPGVLNFIKSDNSPNRANSRDLISKLRGCRQQKVVCCTPEYDEHKIGRFDSSGPAKIFSMNDQCGVSIVPKETVIFEKRQAAEGSWPWLVLLGYKNVVGDIKFKCGGTIISKRHILTAASCVRSDLTMVRLGEHDMKESSTNVQEIDVDEKFVHKKYKKRDGSNDIAILLLADDIIFSDTIQPICGNLPLNATRFLETKLPDAGIKLYEAGWGLSIDGENEDKVLQEQSIQTQNCSLVDERAYIIAALDGAPTTKCTADSGGILMLQYITQSVHHFYPISIVSYAKDCTRSSEHVKYHSIFKYSDWIQEIVSKNN